MVITRTGSRGFFLIELLVVLATTTVLIALLLPAVSAVREAAAAQAATELANKSYAAAALCTPPFCNGLADPLADSQAVSLKYPAIPAGLAAGSVLASGLFVTYDREKLDTQPFGVELWTDNNTHDPGIVVLEALAYALTDDDYAIDKVDWFDDGLDFIVRQPASGQSWKLRALVESDPQSDAPLVRVLAETVPEPSSLLLVAAALLGLAMASRRRGVRPAPRHGVVRRGASSTRSR
jgi:hypothetical protein